jgi:hypothetical protein
MSEKLDKPIVVESTCKVDNQSIMVCFQTDQTIRLKLKGSKDVLIIGVEDLYNHLSNKGTTLPAPVKPVEPKPQVKAPEQPIETKINKSILEIREYNEDEPLLNMNDFRSAYMVMPIPLDVKIKIEAKAVELLGLYKRRKADKAEKREKAEHMVTESGTTEETTATQTKKKRKSPTKKS